MDPAEEEKLKEEIRTRRKIERVSLRIKEEARKFREQERLEKANARISKMLKQTGERKSVKRTRLCIIDVEKDSPTIDLTEDDSVNNDRQIKDELTLCPICQRKFTTANIEAHSANCHDFNDADTDIIKLKMSSVKRRKLPVTP